MHVGNRFKAVALAGTTRLERNTLRRCGCLDMNWHFGVGALWFYALDSDLSGQINVVDTEVLDSPYDAIGVIGSSVTNLSFDNVSVSSVGTVRAISRALACGMHELLCGRAS